MLASVCDCIWKNTYTVAITDLFYSAVQAGSQRNDDGLFGTSGGIGFTKQNELFVGRMAMLGFAVSIMSCLFCNQ